MTRAYTLEGPRWPSNKPILMYVQLGSPGRTLIDGSTSWNAVAESALAIWNPCLGSGVQFSVATTATTNVHGDKRNSVFFSNNAFGYSFGEDTLAITSYLNTAGGAQFTEADVVVNAAYQFDSYRGPLQGNSGYDLRRVLLHEFGHVLGLDHVDQSVVAVMTPVTSDIDNIEADDIAGVEAIYGAIGGVRPVITSSLNTTVGLNRTFQYQATASGGPISYYASGLPIGVNINTTTGVISGSPTYPVGSFNVTLTATNAAGAGTATLVLNVIASPVITSPMRIVAQVGQPFTYQITADGSPTSYEVSGFFGSPLPGVTVNASTGLVSGVMPSGVSYIEVGASNIDGTTTAILFVDSMDAAPVITGVENVNVPADGGHAYTGVPCEFYARTEGSPVTWGATGLPDGLSSPVVGDFGGTPTTPGTYHVTLSVTSVGGTSTYDWTLVVTPGITLTSGGITGEMGTALTYQVTGNPAPTSFQFASTTDHPGLSIDPVTGIISGTPTSVVSGSIQVTLSNGANTATVNVPLNITKPFISTFFNGEVMFARGVYMVFFPNDISFGYYAYLADKGFIYHYDMGYEYVIDANDGKNGAYFYDFASNGFFYSSPTFAFPYLYDFSLNSVVYYYPDPTMAWRYNTNGIRYFYVFSTGQIISK